MNTSMQTSGTARLFIAIPVPAKAKAPLSEKIGEYEDHIYKRIPEANWHITVCFLGGDIKNYEQYIEPLSKPLRQSFLPTATITHMGRGVTPSLLWAYINRTRNLQNIREHIVTRLKTINFPLPKDINREYIPHITLARFAEETTNMAIADTLVNITWPVKEAILYKSISTDKGVEYEPLSSISFNN